MAWAIWQPVVMANEAVARQAEQLGQPAADDLLGHRGGRRGDVEDRRSGPRPRPPSRRPGRRAASPPKTKPKKRGDWLAIRPASAPATRASRTARGSSGPSGSGPPSAARSAAGSVCAGPTRRSGSPSRKSAACPAAALSRSRENIARLYPRPATGWARAAARIAATSDPHRRSSSPSCRPRCASRAGRATSSGSSSRCPPPGHGGHDARRCIASSPSAEAHEDLVEHDVVEDLDAVVRAEPLRKPPAHAQQRSTSSATPPRPSERRAA